MRTHSLFVVGLALVVGVILTAGFVDPNTPGPSSSGSRAGAWVLFGESSPGDEGTGFVVGGRSVQGHDHALKVSVSYSGGPWSVDSDTSFVALWPTDTDGGVRLTESASVDFMGLYQGDTLTVTVEVTGADADTSTVLDTVVQQYVIDHEIITAYIVTAEQLDANGTWDAADSPHSSWSYGVPDTVLADTDGSLIRFMSGSASDTDSTCYDINYARLRSLLVRESSMPAAAQRVLQMWFDIDAIGIPDGAEIVSAELCLTSWETNNFTTNTLYAYADTTSGNSAWHDAPLWLPSGNLLRASLASYAFQDNATEDPWYPPFAIRDYLYEYGIPSEPYSGSVVQGTAMSLDVTRVVQYCIDNGSSINAWTLQSERNADYFDVYNTHDNSAHSLTQYNPFFKIRYKESGSRRYWGDYDFVFSFSTDDQDTANYSYEEIIRSNGGEYTLFVRGDEIPGYSNGGAYTNARKMPPDSLRAFYDRGVDIQNHSLDHGVPMPPGDLSPSWGLANILCTVSDDSLATYEIEMSWLPVDVLGLDESLVPEFDIFAWPAGGYSARGIAVLDSLGFSWARASGSEYPTLNDNVQNPPRFRVGGSYPFQSTDGPRTVVIGDTLNVFMVSNTHNTLDHLTDGAQPDSVVVRNIANAFHWAFKNKVPMVSFTSHGQVGDYSTSTMNTEDLRTIVQYIAARGDTKIASMKWWTDYWLARNQSVDPPTWATGASATWDIFRGPSQ